MKKKSIFIYPHNPKITFTNPYIKNLENSISPNFSIVNSKSKSNAGIFKIFKHLHKLDYIWFNWVEDIPDRKGGYVQIIAFIFLLYLSKLLSIKIIWTMHNKLSHYKKNVRAKKFLFRLLIRNSDFILTHASEGLEIALKYNVPNTTKLKFIHHPISNNLPDGLYTKDNDILIWGSIIPYKGIDIFLDFLYKNNLANRWQIKIIGNIPDKEYESKLYKYSNDHITIQNCFIEFSQLKEEVYRSKLVLFTYLKDSVLSSGALMDSLSMGAKVIGPTYGAFLDLEQYNFVRVYSSFNEIEKIIQSIGKLDLNSEVKNIETFIEENSWPIFGQKIYSWLKQ